MDIVGDRWTMTEELVQPGLRDRLLSGQCQRPRLRPDRVRRPQLLQRLDEAACGVNRLILVSAPAGYGKTTLLSEWASESSFKTAWLALEEQDDTIQRFWTCLATALGNLQPGLGRQTQALLQSGVGWTPERAIATLVDEIDAFSEGFTLVLDDYQSIHSPAVHQSLLRLLTHLPPGVRLAVCTRSDPPLALAQLRARGELAELRAADLRFSLEESAAFLNGVMGLNLSPQGVAALAARTEGWIAGLQLAGLSLQGREDPERSIQAFTGSHRFIQDYLAEQVLARLSEDQVEFLLATSILERLNAGVCSALTGRADSQAILEDLEQHNIFLVPLDEERASYRYHPLFAEFLRRRRLALRPDPSAQLHLLASRWYEEEGSVPQAVGHALAAKAYERAAGLMESAAAAPIRRSAGEPLAGWLEALPAPVRRQHPALGLASVRCLAGRMEVSRAEGRLGEVEQALAGLAPGAAHAAGLDGQAAALRATLSAARQEVAQALQYAGQAEALLLEDDASWRGWVALNLARTYQSGGDWLQAGEACLKASALSQSAGDLDGALGAISLRGEVLEAQGSLRPAARQYEQVLRLAETWQQPQAPATGLALAGLGRIWLQWNDLEKASGCLELGLVRGRRDGRLDVALACLSGLAQVHQARGNLAEALTRLDQAEAVVIQMGIAPPVDQVGALRAQVQQAAGGPATAIQDAPFPEAAIVLARQHLACRQPEEAIRLLERTLQTVESQGRIGNVVQILVAAAVAQRSLGNSEQALALLGRALALGEPEGTVRVFIEQGEPVASLLRRLVARNPHADYARRLLQAMGVALEAAPAGPSGLVETLTGREAEILKLIADGATNREIADELVLTVNTVKKHTSHIFGKLGVASRTQAAAACRLGFLQS